MARKNKGKQKVEMKEITNSALRLTTFSKRRSGAFKKASELSTLCGADIGIVAFSPTGKPYTFGNPDIDSVLGRYLHRYPQANHGKALHMARVDQVLNQELEMRLKELEFAKKQRERLDKNRLEAPIDELSLDDLELLSLSMEFLRDDVERQKMELQSMGSSSSQQVLPVNTSQPVGPSIIDATKTNTFFLPSLWFW